jgi:predicted acetyltransferase
MMIFRVVNEERMEQVRELWSYCFEKSDTPFFQYYFNEYCGKSNTVIGGFEKVNGQERLRTMLHLNFYMLRLRGQKLVLPYLVGVATAPEARGKHALADLLLASFKILRVNDHDFAFLMPIYAGIYLPYEFAYCYYRHYYKISMEELEREVRSLPGSELLVEREVPTQELLAPLYERYTERYNGVPVRTDFQWNKLLTVHRLENVQCAVVHRDGYICGYMLYLFADGCLNIHELLAENFAARNRLLQYAAQHQSSAKNVLWLAEPDDKTYLVFKDQRLTGSLAPFMMARCLNARKALSRLQPAADLPEDSVVLLLTDKLLDENNHLLKLYTAPSSLSVKSTAEDEEVTMDMAAFTQLYFGTFSAQELWEAGRLRTTKPEKLRLLDLLLPKCENYINEYF